MPKINPIKDCLALGNRIELECIVLRAFPAHVNDLILNFLDDVANGLLAVWIKFRDKILCNSVLISVAFAGQKLVQRSRMQREAFDVDVTC